MSSSPDFKRTWLWQHAFVSPQQDVPAAEQEFFRDHYLAMREKAAALVSRIALDVPGLTVHDITHLDALWEMASLVSKGAISLNPAEAFVFGASILLHDAAMSLAAYPNGLDDIKQTLTWKDTVARLMQDGSGTSVVLDDPPPEIVQQAIPEVLRRLHAQQATELAKQSWTTDHGDTEYLIEDGRLRSFYGPTIGQIASSHWWPVAQIEEKLREGLGGEAQLTRSLIDKVKLACLLRVADALHLDQRRAPRFLRALVRPAGVSALHWAFQGRLGVPHLELDAVVFTAGEPFALADAEAWWLAYDTITAVDREIQDVDLLLRQTDRAILGARRIKGVGTPESLARTIQTDGWRPVDTRLRVSDIPKIVETLGGSKLYGDDPTVALRELVQNSADAVQARRKYDDRPGEWGLIRVALSKKEDGHWLSVEDNGIGMSELVLTGPLIDFGNSFWRSPLATEEFPGLVSKGMKAIGRFGIGFFSVFMLGPVVRVISRKCDSGADTARVLEFRDGTGSRPILYPAAARQAPVDGGTRVEVRLKTDPRVLNGLLQVSRYSKTFFALSHLVAAIAPNIDVAIEVLEEGILTKAISPGDWLNIDDNALLTRLDPSPQRPVSGIGEVSRRSLMRPMRDDAGSVFGRAFIEPDETRFSPKGGWVTVGGLRAKRLANLHGVLIGEALTAARDSAVPTVSKEILAAWASDQAQLIAASKMDEEQKARCAEVVLECGGRLARLPVVRWGTKWVHAQEFRRRVASSDELVISFDGDFRYDEDLDAVHPREFRDGFVVEDNVIIVPRHDGAIIDGVRHSWPKSITGRQTWSDSNLAAEVRSILEGRWTDGFSHDTEDRVVGSVDGHPISRSVNVFSRTHAGTTLQNDGVAPIDDEIPF